MATVRQRKHWWKIQWFADQDTPEERKLILKLDLLIVPYAFLAYWIKYIDQANINNAYVSGLKEDLNFRGNELVRLQTMYTLGAVLGQIPCLFLFTRLPMYWIIPLMDVFWGVFTLLQFRVHSFAELAAYRFLVGWFEAGFFPAIHYLGDEIGRRGGFFYVGLTLGTLTAGLIQAGASSNLDGVQGHAGWRWMYIICGIITIPVGVLGYFVIPGTPEMPNRLVLKQEDLDLAERRLKRAGHATKGKFTWGTLGQVARTRKVWLLLVLDVLFWNASINTSSGGFLLWLKSLGRYKASRVNELGAIAPALGIFYTLFICFASDLVLGPAWAIITAHIWNSIGLIILVVWNVPEPAKWFGFITTYSAVAMSSVLYGWVNSELAFSPAARAFTLVLLNTISQSTTAWTPLLAFKTVEGPRFTKGYSYVLGSAIALMATAYALKIIFARQAYPKPVDEEESGGSGTQTPAEYIPMR
ncbi:hypothetical protein KVT40_004160 [Elsinoe batatas]|uniref:Major facilitator superfamily (MFS) profile domain-containing protein n=1 Tax=Elsinoe batatas TaxID=2601811 RepID=A0A8K0L3G0_9PEZI|nr:hypothetical protein KVT40_004160 [Elsinoe batatas]